MEIEVDDDGYLGEVMRRFATLDLGSQEETEEVMEDPTGLQ
jgi:hypothetical protein